MPWLSEATVEVGLFFVPNFQAENRILSQETETLHAAET